MKRMDDWAQEHAMPLTDRSAMHAAGILTMQLRRAGFETHMTMDVPFSVSDLAHRLSALPARGPLLA
jgi:hypothetical protein